MRANELPCRLARDLAGRYHIDFPAAFSDARVSDLWTAIMPHSFSNLAEAPEAGPYIPVTAANSPPMPEAGFRGIARALRRAVRRDKAHVPSTRRLM